MFFQYGGTSYDSLFATAINSKGRIVYRGTSASALYGQSAPTAGSSPWILQLDLNGTITNSYVWDGGNTFGGIVLAPMAIDQKDNVYSNVRVSATFAGFSGPDEGKGGWVDNRGDSELTSLELSSVWGG